ncbi:hypothetical protein HOA93_01655, partial [bacterium]|nr:hypothetical protein [bacterium]
MLLFVIVTNDDSLSHQTNEPIFQSTETIFQSIGLLKTASSSLICDSSK